jgi:tRNA(fMet)-specific endonuclease VapC
VVILDTNILIDYFRQPDNPDSPLIKLTKSKSKEKLAISIITIQELYAGKSSQFLREEQFFLNLIELFQVIAYEQETAKLAGIIMRDTSPTVPFGDAAIAATAILSKAKLLTLNKKDFQGIKKLKLV